MRVCRICKVIKEEIEFPTSGVEYKGKVYRRSWCKECYQVWRAAYRKDHAKELSDKQMLYTRELKSEVITHYGGSCRCCGESRIVFLSIDHVSDNGNKDRQHYGEGNVFYLSLRRRNFPKGFQVLCYNCQMGKYLGKGFCAHNLAIDLRVL